MLCVGGSGVGVRKGDLESVVDRRYFFPYRKGRLAPCGAPKGVRLREKYPECPRLCEEVSTLLNVLCTETCGRIVGYKVARGFDRREAGKAKKTRLRWHSAI